MYASTLLEAALAARLMASGFWRVYSRFTAYVALLSAESVVLLALQQSNHLKLYLPVWIVTRSMALLLETAATVEIFSLWSAGFPGIETIGRKLFLGLLGLSIVFVIATLPADATRGGWKLASQMTSVATRAVHLLCAAFIGLMIAFFARFGGPVASNLRRHAWAMFVFLTASALTYFLVTVSRTFTIANVLLPAVSLLCMMAWLFAIRQGQQVRQKVMISAEELAEYEAAEALSQKLLRFDRKFTLRGLMGPR